MSEFNNEPFFAETNNLAILNRYVANPIISSGSDEASKKRCKISVKIARTILESHASWDGNCPYSIHDIGETFVQAISPKRQRQQESREVSRIYVFFCRFLHEYIFWSNITPSTDDYGLLSCREDIDHLGCISLAPR